MNIFFTAFEQSLLMFPLILGMYISYTILKVTDLTVDGTYILGAAVFARFITSLGLLPAIIFSIISGAIIGNVVGYMQKNNRVDSLIAGILATFMLYSVNLQVLGRPNISTLSMPNILLFFDIKTWYIPLLAIDLLLIVSFSILLHSNLGLLLRAFGHNSKLLNILGKPAEMYRFLGLSISNALAAFAGSLSSQVNGFADINMGFGISLVSIGAIVIGRHIFINFVTTKESFAACKEIISCFIGIFLYFIILGILLYIGIDPINLKFLLGALLFISLSKTYKGKV